MQLNKSKRGMSLVEEIIVIKTWENICTTSDFPTSDIGPVRSRSKKTFSGKLVKK